MFDFYGFVNFLFTFTFDGKFICCKLFSEINYVGIKTLPKRGQIVWKKKAVFITFVFRPPLTLLGGK